MRAGEIKLNAAPLVLAQKTTRGLREASIPVANADAVAGVHRITFTNRYLFDLFVAPDTGSPTQLGSLIHGALASKGIDQSDGGKAAYFNAGAATMTDYSDETVQTVFSPPAAAGSPMQIPFLGANKLTLSAKVVDTTVGQNGGFIMRLYRAVQAQDAAAYLGNPANQALALAHWGPFYTGRASDTPNVMVNSFPIPVGTSFWLEIQNITSAVSVNTIMGSFFFHG